MGLGIHELGFAFTGCGLFVAPVPGIGVLAGEVTSVALSD